MQIRQFGRRTLLSAALAAVSLLGIGAAPAVADSSVTLPIASHSDIVVDGAHQHVFISDPASGSVVVTDYDGALVTQITSEPGASGLALSGDSGTLYVALRNGDAISAIDTATLQETHRYQTGTGTAPAHLALAGGKIWFGYGAAGEGNLGSLDLSGAAPVVDLGLEGPYGWYYAPLLASSPADPATLVAGEPGTSPTTVAVYNVSSGTPQGQAYRWNPGASGSSNLQDMAVTPDGKQVVLAGGYPYYQQALQTSDLSDAGRYTTDAYPNSVAVAPDGTIAAGIDGAYSPDVYLFTPGDSTAFKTWDFPSVSGSITYLRPAGLAWAPDGSRVFAVTENGGSSSLTLQILNFPQAATTVTVQAPASSPRNQDLTLTGTLESAVGFGAGTTVDIWRLDDPTAGEGTLIGSAPVAADGTYSYTDRPKAKGDVQYSVRYAGDARHTSAYGTATVNITSD